jgi:uncharacterized membrane protein
MTDNSLNTERKDQSPSGDKTERLGKEDERDIDENSPDLEKRSSTDTKTQSDEIARGSIFDKIIHFTSLVVEGVKSWIILTTAIAISPALFLWPLFHYRHLDCVLNNQLVRDLRNQSFVFIALSFFFMIFVYTFLIYRKWRTSGWSEAKARIEDLNKRLLGLLVLPFVPPILVNDIETTAPYFTMVLCVGAAVVTFFAIVYFPRAIEISRFRQKNWHRLMPLMIVLLLTSTYAIVAAIFSVNIHINLRTHLHDLGIYDNIMWHSINGRFLACNFCKLGTHVSAHVDPILILLSPLYLISPRAETLLILQAIWLSMTAIPIYLMTRTRLDRPWVGVAFVIIFLLHPALHGAQFFTFHSLSLAAPIIAWIIYSIEIKNWKMHFVFFALLLLVREDMALLSCFIGFYLILSKRSIAVGLVTIVVALLYLFVIKTFVMPDSALLMDGSSGAHSYSVYYSALIPHNDGARGIILSLLTNPFFVLRHIFVPEKLMFLATLFAPVLFLPFVASRGKVMMFYGFVFLLLASREAVFSVHFQYTTILYPIIFMLVPIALSEVKEWRFVGWLKLDAPRIVTALTIGSLIAGVAVSAKFGGLIPNDSFRAGHGRPDFTVSRSARERFEWVEETKSMVPMDASIAASRFLVPHISARTKAGRFPMDWGTDYILINTRMARPWGRINYERLMSKNAYEVLRENGDIKLLKRRKNVPLPRRLREPR